MTWFSKDSTKVLTVWWVFVGVHFLSGLGLNRIISSFLSAGWLFLKWACNLILRPKFDMSFIS